MKFKRTMSVLATGVILMSLLSGCGNHEDTDSGEEQNAQVSDKIDTVIITTIRQCQPLPNSSVISETAADTCDSGGELWLVTADSEPNAAAHAQYKGISVFGKSEHDSQLEEYTKEVVNQVGQNCRAQNVESDLLGAINKAAAILENSCNSKKLVIYDNGISTAGVLTMQGSKGITSIGFDDMLADLKQNNELSSLDGVAVDVYGIGMTDLPQQELNSNEQQLLQDFWDKVLHEAHASSVTFHSITSSQSAAEVEGLPEVSTIKVEGNKDYISDHLIENPYTFDETAVAFKDNSNELVDKEAAKKALQEVANTLKEYPQDVYVAGTTAYDADTAGCVERAEGRANAICDLMADEMGVDRSCLHVAALGCDGPFYTAENGNEDIAKANRNVTIIGYYSDKGAEIREFIAE